jgi:DNA-binding transcriptional ArsR family regulator
MQRAIDLSRLFKVLASETRLRLLHALCKNDQMCVSDLAVRLRMKPQAVSNQLQRLADLGVVARQRDGNNINYTIGDCCMVAVLDYALCHSEDGPKRSKGGMR